MRHWVVLQLVHSKVREVFMDKCYHCEQLITREKYYDSEHNNEKCKFAMIAS